MQHMASDPPELFRQAADTVDDLLTRVNEIVPKLCTEVLYGCHISDDCRDNPIQALLRARPLPAGHTRPSPPRPPSCSQSTREAVIAILADLHPWRWFS